MCFLGMLKRRLYQTYPQLNRILPKRILHTSPFNLLVYPSLHPSPRESLEGCNHLLTWKRGSWCKNDRKCRNILAEIPTIKQKGGCDFLYEDKREIETHTVKGTWGRGKTFSMKVPQFFPKVMSLVMEITWALFRVDA